MDSEISKIDKGTPYIVKISSDADVGNQFFVVIEKNFLSESGKFSTALLDLFAAYFVYDIAYPQPLYACLIFIQHYIFGMDDKQNVPNNAKILYSSLAKVEVESI